MMTAHDGSKLSAKAIKKLAREYQQDHPGVPYPVARRAVLGTWRPLTVLISETDEQLLRITLEESVNDGDGIHAGVVGPTGSGKTNLLTVMAQSIRRQPPSRGAEVIAVGDFLKGTALNAACDKVVGDSDFAAILTEVCSTRLAELRQRGWQQNMVTRDDALPAIVMMLDDTIIGSLVGAPERVLGLPLRAGRSLDVHMVIAWGADDYPLGPNYWSPQKWWYPHLQSVIELSGRRPVRGEAEVSTDPRPWQGRWHRPGFMEPVDLAVPLAGAE
ncbi:hypothetical protein [Mycolicibacterium mucogenicum]|jgi:energy-coupling factor transporter ATP-binding protein EcfA2|uniref:hypothetical protein n=1 Tax=Mycolicibacterium mucogenicum TaxID=56689 RepID=UPI00076A1281|nr:hypothetical protein [Mycolicibacterium mucogenicum]